MHNLSSYAQQEHAALEELGPNGRPFALSQERLDALLHAVSGGDYGHIGGADFINIILNKAKNLLPDVIEGHVLSLNSNFNDEADLLERQGFKHVWKSSDQATALEQAKAKYPKGNFHDNPLQINHLYPADFFEFVYLLNVASSVRDKPELLQKLEAICKENALIAIFDLVAKDPQYLVGLHDLTGQPFFPLESEELLVHLKATGWQVLETIDVTENYSFWYGFALDFISTRRDLLVAAGFTADEIEVSNKLFHNTLNLIQDGKLGGILIFAKKLRTKYDLSLMI